jgi:hypothetical protein
MPVAFHAKRSDYIDISDFDHHLAEVLSDEGVPE